MAKKQDLMGLGLSPNLARRLATEPSMITAQGSSYASATVLNGDQFLVSVTATNTGGGVGVPAVGGSNGCCLGDDFIINNQIVGGITLYGPAGSEISMNGALTSLSTGQALSSHTCTTIYAITATTWIGIQGT